MKNKLFTGIIVCLAMAFLQLACKSNTGNKQVSNSMVNAVSDTEKSGQLSSTNVQHDTDTANQDKEKSTHQQTLQNQEVPDEPPPTQEQLKAIDDGVVVSEAITVKENQVMLRAKMK